MKGAYNLIKWVDIIFTNISLLTQTACSTGFVSWFNKTIYLIESAEYPERWVHNEKHWQ